MIEIKRKAKVGEWIKIINATENSTLKNGEIHKVESSDKVSHFGAVYVDTNKYMLDYVLYEEYITLEGFQEGEK